MNTSHPDGLVGGGTPGGLDDDRLNDETVGIDPDLAMDDDDADEPNPDVHPPRPGIETFEDADRD